jgi:hypothetical protein
MRMPARDDRGSLCRDEAARDEVHGQAERGCDTPEVSPL